MLLPTWKNLQISLRKKIELGRYFCYRYSPTPWLQGGWVGEWPGGQAKENRKCRWHGVKTDWWDNVNVGEQYAENCQEVLGTLSEFLTMRDGCLGGTGMAIQLIKLSLPIVHPINAAPHRAGLKAREFNMTEIDKMIRMNVVENLQSK